MEYVEVKELVRIRFELRRLAVGGENGAVATLLERMGELAARDSRELAAVRPEIERWRAVFGLRI
jgi:hypothetical protein